MSPDLPSVPIVMINLLKHKDHIKQLIKYCQNSLWFVYGSFSPCSLLNSQSYFIFLQILVKYIFQDSVHLKNDLKRTVCLWDWTCKSNVLGNWLFWSLISLHFQHCARKILHPHLLLLVNKSKVTRWWFL